jgi:DNA-binding transcriptional MerR regulator
MANVHRLPVLGSTAAVPVWGPGPVSAAPAHDEGEDEGADFLQVGDLAREVGKTVRAIHHYESIGLLKPHRRSKGRYRLYAKDAVARVRWVGKLHDLGMSLAQIQQILALWGQAPNAPEAMRQIRAIYQQKLEEVRSQIARLSTLEREVGASLDYLDTCNTCDPNELVAACSGCTNHDHDAAQPELVAGIYATAGEPKS